ncbi:hypothetical protein COCMIDRAFT_84007 [Bipolaris oryzae ATCC 44560]|uniref:Aminoglycoside phosphotransferase domain-containing protein n=1 Tax=Bipolaris oryzae ATCC 44560 TaxID=930090 RepID=W6ZIB7_COCMI|nr:uncharacterized protein COCMIDRAFT_84007 [Bipolaris oryzae ATCC 44560]EUC49683.1 hypothetical protein COCMIDRAFT_84007 [Bipolaris oryzae ATCC 44560]
MSRGTYAVKPVRSSTSTSSSSTSSSTSSLSRASIQTTVTTVDTSSIQRLIRTVYRSSKITVQQVEVIQGYLGQIYVTRLADGSSLVLKCPPAHNVRLLRHEKHILDTERKTLEMIREYTRIPVPQLITFDTHSSTLGRPFLLMSHIPGRRLSELAPYLTPSERNAIDHTLGMHIGSLTALSAPQFGLAHRVFAKKGSTTWREAFLGLLESMLRDAEDMLVNLHSESIRYWIGKHAHHLDKVTEPRLVAPNACNADNVLLDEHTKHVVGLVGFSNIIWGDPLMSGGMADASEAFLTGLGECAPRTTTTTTIGSSSSAQVRIMIYRIYRATLRLVAHHYRLHDGTDELDARRELSAALNLLAAV